jgi:hypothetical protein
MQSIEASKFATCRVTRSVAKVSLNYEAQCPLALYLYVEVNRIPHLRDSRVTATQL